MRGAPLIVSVLVIVLAILRVLQFDYISTILDALPFGTIFGMVVMTYMLFWFVEYWMNRVLAVCGSSDPMRTNLPWLTLEPPLLRLIYASLRRADLSCRTE
jgi:hypothetical protein